MNLWSYAMQKVRDTGGPDIPPQIHNANLVSIESLKEHPDNYRSHPDDQLKHLVASIREHGFYRPVVIAQDMTILAGHGVVKAARLLGMEQVPVAQLPIASDSPRAIKLLAGDNTIAHLSVDDERALTGMLKGLGEMDDLLGTGFDENMLASLVMVTRPASEIADFNAAAEWVGMPDYDEGQNPLQIVISFTSEQDRDRFVEETEIKIDKRGNQTAWSTRWPYTDQCDLASLKFEDGDG